MTFLTEQERSAVDEASLLIKQVDKLYERIFELLDPLTKRTALTQDAEIIMNVVKQMPACGHRAELRSLVNSIRHNRHFKQGI